MDARTSGTLGQLYGGTNVDPGDLIADFSPMRKIGCLPCVLLFAAGVVAIVVSIGIAGSFMPWGWPGCFLIGGSYAMLTLRTARPVGQTRYQVTSRALVATGPAGRLVVPWENVREVFHRPFAQSMSGSMWSGYTKTYYHEYCDLILDGTAQRLRIIGARRQERLSAMIINATRDQVVARLTAHFEKAGLLRLGELTVTRSGICDPRGTSLPWSTQWKFSTRFLRRTPNGAALTIRDIDGARLTVVVPESEITKTLLIRLSSQRNHSDPPIR